MGNYDIGDRVTLRAEFSSPDVEYPEASGYYVDPAEVRFLVAAPGGAVATYTHGTGSQVGRTATGRYYTEVVATGPGQWAYRGVGTGGPQGAEETTFHVASSVF